MTFFSTFMKNSPRNSLIIGILFILFFLLPAATNVLARDVTFIWTANPETVEGYRLYYKTGSSGQPYNGTGATEGPSPVPTGDVATYTLHDLLDTETYYFTLTAYLGAEESAYATEIVLPPGNAPRILLIDEIK